MQNRILAALLVLLTAALPALAQQFPSTMPPNTVYGRFGPTSGPGQPIPFARIQSTATAAIVGGTVTGTAITGGTISGAAIASAAITAGTISGAAFSSGTIFGTSISSSTFNGGSITAATITGLGNPVNSGDAVNKQYVDAFVQGLIILPQSTYATAAVLPNTPTYSNGTLGVGATLTAGANSTLTVDGTVAALNSVVLVKNQASAFQNGIYTLTTAGSGAAAWVLTRATYFDQAAEMAAHSYTYITAGATNLNTAWVLQTTVATVGTDSQTWNLYSNVSNYWTLSGSDAYRAAGNLGIGGAPSAWGAPYTSVAQLGSATFGRLSGDVAAVVANMYFDGSNYKYLNNGTAALGLLNNGGAYSWYTAPSGTAGNSATITERMNLSNLGVLTLGSYGAGVANLNTSGVVSSKTDYTTSIIYAANHGVTANGVTDDTLAVIAAVARCNNGLNAAYKGAEIVWPVGRIVVTAANLPAGGIDLSSCSKVTGQGSSGGYGAAAQGTEFFTTCTTCNIFKVSSNSPPTFRDFAIRLPYASTSGTILYVDPVAANAAGHGLILDGMRFEGGFVQVSLRSQANVTIANNQFVDTASKMLYATIDPTCTCSGDLGDSRIIGNTFQEIFNTGGVGSVAIHLDPWSGISILGNKFTTAASGAGSLQYLIYLSVSQPFNTGSLLISGNSIEGGSVNGIRVQNTGSGTAYGDIHINHNEFGFASTNSAAIAFFGAGSSYLVRCEISYNTFGVGGGTLNPAISLEDCPGIDISHNQITMNSGNGDGIALASFATDATVAHNRLYNSTGRLYRTLPATTTVIAPKGLPFAELGAWANGSQIFVTDADPATSPCTSAGAKTGSTAFRQNTAWKCF